MAFEEDRSINRYVRTRCCIRNISVISLFRDSPLYYHYNLTRLIILTCIQSTAYYFQKTIDDRRGHTGEGTLVLLRLSFHLRLRGGHRERRERNRRVLFQRFDTDR